MAIPFADILQDGDFPVRSVGAYTHFNDIVVYAPSERISTERVKCVKYLNGGKMKKLVKHGGLEKSKTKKKHLQNLVYEKTMPEHVFYRGTLCSYNTHYKKVSAMSLPGSRSA
jgi:hypothetical protein